MDETFLDIFHQARRILCKCPNCGEISRLGEIEIKSKKKTAKIWLDKYQSNVNEFQAAKGEFEQIKAQKRQDAILKGRAQVEKEMKKTMRKSLHKDFQKIKYDPYDIKTISHPVEFVVFDGMNNDELNQVILLSRRTSDVVQKELHKSIKDTIEQKRYDWKVAKILDGEIEIE